jgi:general secretion pathway protein G
MSITERPTRRRSSALRVTLVCVCVAFGMLIAYWVGFVLGVRWATHMDTRGINASVQLSAIRLGLEMFYADMGRFPTAKEGLKVITEPVGQGPYIKAMEITDPWGRPFLYQYSGTGVPTVTTLGADGVPGVTSDSADQDLSTRPAIGPGAFPRGWRPLTTQKTQGPPGP